MVTTRTHSIDTETGQRVLIDVEHDELFDTYTFAVSGELIELAPEALTAAIQMMVLDVRAERTHASAAEVRP